MQGLRLFIRQLHREIMLHYRAPRHLAYASLFFLMTLIFFPLTISAEIETLRPISPGLIWIDLLFAFFLSSERLFQQDYDDGVIEQWLVSGVSIQLLVGAKVLAHWMLTLLPLLMLCPLIGVCLHLSTYEVVILILSILCGSPAIVFLCALAAAFSTGLKQKGILMALILFPLTIPIMIFGSATLATSMQGLPIQGYFAILLALSIMAVGLLPFAIAGVASINLVD
jgi:heme exporter protein B